MMFKAFYRARVYIFVSLIVCTLILLDVHSALNAEDTTPIPMISGIEMLKVGDKAPNFSVLDTDGNPFSMNQTMTSGKGVLIFFWSIFCEPCKAELPVIQNLIKRYSDKGISFIGVAIDGEPMKDAIAAYVRQEGWGFRALIDELNEDESFKVSDPYGVAGTPTLYIIDSGGVVKFAKVGRAAEAELEEALKGIL